MKYPQETGIKNFRSTEKFWKRTLLRMKRNGEYRKDRDDKQF